MNRNGTCHFLDRSTNNYVKNISFYGDYNYIKCTFKSLEKIEYKPNSTIKDTFSFSSCEKLQNVVLPFKCTNITSGAFKNCMNVFNNNKIVQVFQDVPKKISQHEGIHHNPLENSLISQNENDDN